MPEKVDVLWEESGDDEAERVTKRPRPSSTLAAVDLSMFWVDVTYTKQVNQKKKKSIDGRVQMYPRTLTAKLFDLEGTYVCSGNFQTVLGFTERWNKAVQEGTDITITKGFYAHLVFVPTPTRELPQGAVHNH
jgi:Protein of unknown function (DUF2439)